jgi:mono/diheme cytochrome c family protein
VKKGLNFWAQLALALVGVFSLLAIIQGMAQARREVASAYATALCQLETLDPILIDEGQRVYNEHCAACHGAELQGAEGWEIALEDGSHRPLPLNNAAHAWQHSDSGLIKTIQLGRNAGKLSAMPAFGDKLSEREIRAVVEFIKNNWGVSERTQQQILNSGTPTPAP